MGRRMGGGQLQALSRTAAEQDQTAVAAAAVWINSFGLVHGSFHACMHAHPNGSKERLLPPPFPPSHLRGRQRQSRLTSWNAGPALARERRRLGTAGGLVSSHCRALLHEWKGAGVSSSGKGVDAQLAMHRRMQS